MVAEVGASATTAVLSNTNALHWETQVDAGQIASLFDRHYLSYELGLVKPDIEIFQRVLADLGEEADAVLFLDDNQVNVEAGRAAGIQAHRVRGVGEARAVLARYGLTTPTSQTG
jgi:putative hydrolase of the HAD superfamily